MELTPEERQKIMAEEKARVEARIQIINKARQKQSKIMRKWFLIPSGVFLAVCVVLSVALFLSPHSGNNQPSKMEGQNVVLDNGLSSVMVATRKESYDALYSTVSEGNIKGLQSLIITGEVIAVDQGTEALILEKTFTSGTKVRILKGPNSGTDCWVPGDWVK